MGLGFGERAEGWWGAQIRAFAPLTRERTHFYNHSGGMWGPTKSLQPQGDWSSVEPFQAVGRRARGTCSTGMKKKRRKGKKERKTPRLERVKRFLTRGAPPKHHRLQQTRRLKHCLCPTAAPYYLPLSVPATTHFCDADVADSTA